MLLIDKKDYIINYENAIKSSESSIQAIIYQNKEFYSKYKNVNINKKYQIYENLNIEDNLLDILTEISRLFEMELSTFILMNIYLDRYSEINNVFFSWDNIFLLIVCASLAALKVNEDEMYPLRYYSSVTDVNLDILSNAESTFYQQSNYNFFVSDRLYLKYYKSMINN